MEDFHKLCDPIMFEIKKCVKNEMFQNRITTTKYLKLQIPYNCGKAMG